MIVREEYTNSLGMRFARIEQGNFVMGADVSPLPVWMAGNKHRLNGDFDEHPRHRVTIGNPFYMSVFEVTNQQYEHFDPEHHKLRGKLGFSVDDDEAVVYITWHDAVAFCEWLSEREGQPCRLPTEAEWEYACRAGGIDPFHTGEQLPESFRKNARESWYPDLTRSIDGDTVPLHVGKTEPNLWGLYDMHGNVEEWCLDWYGPYAETHQIDPVGRIDGDFRVTRGGSHSTEIYYLRSANRMGALPDDSSWLIGFRVVMGEMPGTEPLPLPPLQTYQLGVHAGKTSDQEVRPSEEPFFAGPNPFVKVPPGSFGPMYSEHNHLPSVVECPNGDLLAVWFSCLRERGRELTLLASRLRYGKNEWDPASPFWDAPDRNMTGSALWRDGDIIYLFGAISAAATWGNMIMYMRKSEDSGVTWSKAEIIYPDHANGQSVPISVVFRAQDGSVLLPYDDGSVFGTRLCISMDNGNTWKGSAGNAEGIHSAVVQLRDGKLLAFGRRKGRGWSGKMPQSISNDMGATWEVSESPFDPVSGGQRTVMLRLIEGPLLFCSFAKKMTITDVSGAVRTVRGLFATLSYDEGATWPVRRLITDDGPGLWVDGGAWTGKFFMSCSFAEPRGYLTATQSTNGIIHLLSSHNHYSFNLKWLETSPPEPDGDGLL